MIDEVKCAEERKRLKNLPKKLFMITDYYDIFLSIVKKEMLEAVHR